MATNKNSMLPTFEGTYNDMIGALKAGVIKSPCWMYLNDREVLVFIHWETINEEKQLVPKVMLWDKLTELQDKIDDIDNSLGDIKESLPEGETMSDFVTNTTEVQKEIVVQVENVSKDVNTVQTEVTTLKEQVGNVIMITSKDLEVDKNV